MAQNTPQGQDYQESSPPHLALPSSRLSNRPGLKKVIFMPQVFLGMHHSPVVWEFLAFPGNSTMRWVSSDPAGSGSSWAVDWVQPGTGSVDAWSLEQLDTCQLVRWLWVVFVYMKVVTGHTSGQRELIQVNDEARCYFCIQTGTIVMAISPWDNTCIHTVRQCLYYGILSMLIIVTLSDLLPTAPHCDNFQAHTMRYLYRETMPTSIYSQVMPMLILA